MKRLGTPDDGKISRHGPSRLSPARRYIKKPFLTAAFVAAVSAASLADDTDWTDYVVPGEQTGTQIAYQPIYPYGPGGNSNSSMCQLGKLTTDAAWYRFCICYGNTGCFITYESIATYECNGKRMLVMTARGKTKKACGKAGLQATMKIIKDLGEGFDDKYNYDVQLPKESQPSDSEVTKLIVDQGKRPDENSKKVEEKKETTEEKKETKTTNEGGSGGGKTDKRPRKHVTKKSSHTHARRETETRQKTDTSSTGAGSGGGISIGIGIGRLGGFGGHERGGEGRSSGDRGGSKN